MADPLVVFGSGGHAKVVVEAVLSRSPDRNIILVDDAPENHDRSIFGIAVAGARDLLESLRGTPVIPAVGDNRARSRLIEWLVSERHVLETVIHPAALIATSVQIGQGSFVAAGAISIAEAQIGAGAIINTGATVDHDCTIGDCAHIGPGVHLCGNVRIGARTLVGVGAAVKPGVSIADDAVVGAGAVVVRDIAMAGTYVGNPARQVHRS